MQKKWWKEAVAYQIYPRSFMDSNGDGIGDLQGIITKLDYLEDFGVDVIWVCPIYSSPNDDNGYDISDYKGVMNEFGSMADFDELLTEVHARGMKLILDLVINHTSDEHRWFIESRSSKDNQYRDYYIWAPAKNGQEPNNWESIFGGSAWEYDEKTEEYYLHVFSRKQPDLNWENSTVRREIYEMINWWLDKGIDGFRIDAISHIKKAAGYPDLPNPDNKKYVPSFDGHMNQPGIDVFLTELNRETFSKYNIVTVGEANGVKAEEADKWVGEKDGYFNMIFQFEHLDLWGRDTEEGLDIFSLKKTLSKWQYALHNKGWNALFLENHDQPRSVSTWGNEKYWDKSAKCLATFYFIMQGTPFIYQGQEIGMTNVQFDSIEDYNDVAIKNYYKSELRAGKAHQEIMKVIWKTGRDNSRTPMQWNKNQYAGFSTCRPWLKVNENYEEINVEKAISDSNSIYHYYKKLIQLRKEQPALVYGSYQLILEDHPQVYAYTRKLKSSTVLIITNLFKEAATFTMPKNLTKKRAEILINNYDVRKAESISKLTLQPYEARVYLLT